MTVHRLDAAVDTTVDVFSRDQEPALTVDPGDTVVVRSLDASGYLEPQRSPGQEQPTMFAASRGHCLSGPIAVNGALPGMTLAIRFASLRPGPWGWTVAAARDTPLNRRLGLAGADPSWLLWSLDATAKIGTDQFGHRVPLAPFLGVIGVPPVEVGAHSTVPPRTGSGGNIDCRSLVAGSTLYLPVTVPGALLSMGDGHAAQGDGEVSGTAIECPMTTTVGLDLVSSPAIPGIHAETPSGRITFGFDEDLDEAMVQALDAMLTWMQVIHQLDRATTLALASPIVDLGITQVANGVWGVHAVLPPQLEGG